MPTRRGTLLAVLTSGAVLAAPAPFQSRYTSLAQADCTTLSVDAEGGGSTQRCPGLTGYGVLAQEGDLRQSITLIAPGGRQWDLNLWSDGFSSLGPRAEWRGRLAGGRFVPSALIVRLNVSEDPEHPERQTSLMVARLTPHPCLTARIAPGPRMNLQARAEADRAASRPCLGSSR